MVRYIWAPYRALELVPWAFALRQWKVQRVGYSCWEYRTERSCTLDFNNDDDDDDDDDEKSNQNSNSKNNNKNKHNKNTKNKN